MSSISSISQFRLTNVQLGPFGHHTMSAIDLHLREASTLSSEPAPPKRKPAPKKSKIPVPFTYTSSDDGTDENLLILLHGLGDTHDPFAKLGKSLKLPQTATLALRGTQQLPWLDEPAFEWYTSFDLLGEPVPPSKVDPRPAFDLLEAVLAYLTSEECGKWPKEKIHFFGFAQGGSVALQIALKMWKDALAAKQEPRRLGSIVSVNGPLLSHPTALSTPCTTPVHIAYRPQPSSSTDSMSVTQATVSSIRKVFPNISESKMGPRGGMPSSKEEWEPIMRFWSENLGRRQSHRPGGDGALYEVMTNGI